MILALSSNGQIMVYFQYFLSLSTSYTNSHPSCNSWTWN